MNRKEEARVQFRMADYYELHTDRRRGSWKSILVVKTIWVAVIGLTVSWVWLLCWMIGWLIRTR